MLNRTISLDTLNVISSPVSEAGVTLSDLQDGPMIARVGLSVAPVNLSARQAKAAGLLMSGIYGPLPIGSLCNEDQSQCLENRLRAKMDSRGSTLFKLTWKTRLTPHGRRISALRALVPRISDKDCIGVPTPDTHECGGPQNPAKSPLGGHSVRLQDTVTLASIDTPRATERTGGNRNSLRSSAKLMSVQTPAGMSLTGVNPDGSLRSKLDRLPSQALLADFGEIVTGGTEKTKNSDPLNPDYSRWLMGYPAEWGSCADMATLLFQNSRKRSSKQRKVGK